jgi:hypothetical protein
LSRIEGKKDKPVVFGHDLTHEIKTAEMKKPAVQKKRLVLPAKRQIRRNPEQYLLLP